VKYREIIATTSRKSVGVTAACQQWIAAGEQFGLLTLIATTEGVSFWMRMKI